LWIIRLLIEKGAKGTISGECHKGDSAVIKKKESVAGAWTQTGGI